MITVTKVPASATAAPNAVQPVEPLVAEKTIEREYGLPADHLRDCRRRRTDDPPPFIKRRSRYYYRHSEFVAWLNKGRSAVTAAE
jgi:hypothetical protein